jgi:ABC-type lipoprotein release transport system permease subunit
MAPAGRNVQSRRAPGSLAASRLALSFVPVFQPLPVFVGLRYVRTRRQGFFVSFISWISMAGVGIGVAALITILSVMNGFEGELRSRLVSLTAHATVTGPPPQLADWRHTARRLAAIDGVVGVAPFVDVQAMIGRLGALEPVLLHGVDAAAEPGVSTIERHLLQGRLEALRAGSRSMIVGRVLAWQIGAEVGDELTVLVPGRDMLASVFPRHPHREDDDGLILLLIVAVAAFNIVAMLVMVVTDKRTDIAILRTLGASPRGVMGVFLTQGLVIGWFGVLLGVALGVSPSPQRRHDRAAARTPVRLPCDGPGSSTTSRASLGAALGRRSPGSAARRSR